MAQVNRSDNNKCLRTCVEQTRIAETISLCLQNINDYNQVLTKSVL